MKKSIEHQIHEFLQDWDLKQMTSFFRDTMPLIELFDVNEADDWVMKETNSDAKETQIIRLIRTVYLASKIADNHAGRLARLQAKYPGLWRKLDKIRMEANE